MTTLETKQEQGKSFADNQGRRPSDGGRTQTSFITEFPLVLAFTDEILLSVLLLQYLVAVSVME